MRYRIYGAVFVAIFLLSGQAAAQFSDDEKAYLESSCRNLSSSVAMQEIMKIDGKKYQASTLYNSGDFLADWESYSYVCGLAKENGASIDLMSGIDETRNRVAIDLALDGQPICRQYSAKAQQEIAELLKKIDSKPFDTGSKAAGIAVVLKLLHEKCSDAGLKTTIAQLYNYAKQIETAGFGYYRCVPFGEDFQQKMTAFESAYFKKAGTDITAEDAFQAAYASGVAIAQANCLQQQAQAEQVLGNMQAMLNDPQRAEKVACQQQVDRYKQEQTREYEIWQKSGSDEAHVSSGYRAALDAAMSACAAFKDVTLQLSNLNQNFERSMLR